MWVKVSEECMYLISLRSMFYKEIVEQERCIINSEKVMFKKIKIFRESVWKLSLKPVSTDILELLLNILVQ